jgi:ABC-type transport system substrate-binding protein
MAGGGRLMRRMTRRELIAGTLAPALASCGLSKVHQSRSGSTVTILYEGEPEECFRPYEDASAKFLVFMPLVAWNNRGELEGRLAELWDPSPDFRTWTIRLREGIRWHDGVPVTAHDMKFTLDLLQHPEAMSFAPGSYSVSTRRQNICHQLSSPGPGEPGWRARRLHCVLAKTPAGKTGSGAD